MTTPICRGTLVGVGIISLLILSLFPVYPMLAISFEAGLITGLFLHSSHTSYAVNSGYLEQLNRKL